MTVVSVTTLPVAGAAFNNFFFYLRNLYQV